MGDLNDALRIVGGFRRRGRCAVNYLLLAPGVNDDISRGGAALATGCDRMALQADRFKNSEMSIISQQAEGLGEWDIAGRYA
ncbi:hypothetical protein DMA11_16420 [Marinilabiliaceae bacterium JC017]|nr:hypothetical protein DMA11_16420 [Marinilabiliaceae bacterium JC017]